MRWEMKCVTGKTQATRLRKRTGPSTSYRIVGWFYYGNKFVATDLKTVGGNTWYKIEGTSYWCCGKKGSSTYVEKVKDLDPPKPPAPAPTPPPAPNPPPVPDPYYPPKFPDYKLPDGWSREPSEQDWYIKATFDYGSNKIATEEEIQKEIKRIRYNMDISYANKNEAFYDNGGYYTTLQPKLHNSFNRNKTTFPDKELNKTFAYVFFTRPDLNILEKNGSTWSLNTQVKPDPKYNYLWKNNNSCLLSLVSNSNTKHKFLCLLSNEAKSFEVSDHVIKTAEHGETYTGGKVIYGRTDHESNTAGEINIRYQDTVNLDVFKMHTLWVDYISKVSRGIFSPKRTYIQQRFLDYASSCYYILCGPDGSTILYWMKLTGIFPTNTSENSFSWDSGTLLAKPEINIKYVYSMKTPMDVTHLNEFNVLSAGNGIKNPKIKNTYSQDNCASGSTMTHSPYIIPSTIGGKFVYRLVWLDPQ